MTWVLELIDEKKCYWKEDAIKAVLPMHETEIICMIPLCDTRPEDQLIWHYNKEKNFHKISVLDDNGSLEALE